MKTQVKLFANPTTEAQHQINIIRWTQIVRDIYPELELLYHIPNGGGRDAKEGKHLREQGVKPGVPDLCLPVPRGQYDALYIELKTEKGSPSPEQEWWICQLRVEGNYAVVCYGWRSAIKIIEWYMKLEGGK